MNLKICGNMEKSSVDAAVNAGATHVGFIMSAGFRRSVSADSVAKMTADVPKTVKKVGVFVNEPIDFVKNTVKSAGLDVVQLHGAEDMDYIRALGDISVIKALSDFSKIPEYDTVTLLLDAPSGGSGKLADFSAVKFDDISLPYFIAGGLTPDNIAEVVKKYPNAYGFDVSSGVETDGKKDGEKIKTFIWNATLSQPEDADFSAGLSEKFDDFDADLGLKIPIQTIQFKIENNGIFQAGLVARQMGTSIDIQQLFVAEPFRKAGLGHFLLKKIETYAKTNDIHYLTLNTLSIYAPNYYQRYGFHVYHTLHDCPLKGIDLLRLQKEI